MTPLTAVAMVLAAGAADVIYLDGRAGPDDGHGDARAVVRMVEVYARLGVSGIVLEDPVRAAKQSGDAGAIGVVSVDEMVQKIRVAIAAIGGSEIQLIARCDACQLEGLEAAMRRADRYLHAGAHGIFIPGVPTVQGLRAVGARFGGAHLMIAVFEGHPTWSPALRGGRPRAGYPGTAAKRSASILPPGHLGASRAAPAPPAV